MESPNTNSPIKFRTKLCNDLFTGKRIENNSMGKTYSFYITDEIPGNRHWLSSILPGEVVEWEYIVNQTN